jgi:UDP-glucose 4-epimerase
MILVTGGTGFIGTHTVRALLDMGEPCILMQRRDAAPPPLLHDAPVAVERADVTDLDALLEIGARHEVSGIVHLAGSVPWPPGSDDAVAGARKAITGLLNIVQAAKEWSVSRVSVASTIGIYGGVDAVGALHEEMPLPIRSAHVIPAFKKIGELLTDHLAPATGVELVNARISAAWGPLGRPASPFFAAPQLIHAAVRGAGLDLSPLSMPVYAEDAIDMCYVKDCARGIALLQLADHLRHRTYNVGAGRATSNAEVIAAIEKAVPGAHVELPTGGCGPRNYLDISRLHEDTGFRPAYAIDHAVADYVGWLRRVS